MKCKSIYYIVRKKYDYELCRFNSDHSITELECNRKFQHTGMCRWNDNGWIKHSWTKKEAEESKFKAFCTELGDKK